MYHGHCHVTQSWSYTAGDGESFETFIRAIFYVGKGQKSRPYQHFKEAIAFLNGTKNKVTFFVISLVLIDHIF